MVVLKHQHARPASAHAAGPDLTAQSVSGPLAGTAGAKLTAKYGVRNAGSEPAPRSVSIWREARRSVGMREDELRRQIDDRFATMKVQFDRAHSLRQALAVGFGFSLLVGLVALAVL